MNSIRTDYRLKPHYRLQSPLDEVALAIQPGLDAFLAEKDAEEIEAVLEKWSQALRRSPWDFEVIKEFISSEIKATSLRPTEEHSLRSDPGVQIWRKGFSPHPVLGQEEFLRELPSLVDPSLKLTTADFRLESILVSEQSPTLISTRVCYELVGSLSGHSREQRIGHWELDWEKNREGILSIRRWRALEETRSLVKGPGFRDITAQVLGQNSSYAAHLLRGTDDWRTVLDVACGIDIYGNNGIALGDIDNDEYDDLYVCQPAGLPNRLYRNRRDGTFEDITEMAGVGVIDNTASALFVDVDNDGHQDLIVVRASGPLLFLNQGGGKFVIKRDAFRFSQPPQGVFTSAAAADYDRDGWLDIYLCTYIYYQGQEQYRFPVPYHDAQNGPPNFLFRNNRDGSFSDVTAATKLTQSNNRYSFACGWCDFNEDGWPDLYVANDFGKKNLYLNNAGETFSDIAAEAGVEDVGAGMSVCWFDYDNDGKQDLYVGNMWSDPGKRVTFQKPFMERASANTRTAYQKHASGNSLFRNQGDGSFQDTSRTAGVEMARWSWSGDAWDFDHDGYPDLYIATGMISGPNRKDLSSFFWRQVVAHSPLEAIPSPNYEQGWNAINELIRSDWTWNGYERNVFYANNRDGTFSDVSGAVGLDFPDDARAFALADFDHDGRLEIFLKNRNAPQLRILHNELEHVGSAIAFRLRGRKSNRDAIGAVVTIETKEGHQVRSLQAGSGFLSQHTKELLFGLGTSQGPVNVKVRWPSGLVEFFEQVPLGHRVGIEEGSGHFRAQPFAAKTQFTMAAAEQSSGPPSSAFGTWLIEPLAAPEFELPDLDGQIYRLSSFRGRPVLLNFWATWSQPCHAELAAFQEHHAKWAVTGLQVISVNVNDPGEVATVRSFARARQLMFPILLASQDVAGMYNVLYRYLFDRRRDLEIPSSLLIDDGGFIVKIFQGPISPVQLREDLLQMPKSPDERMTKALPFSGRFYADGFHRNYFTHGVAFFRRGYLEQAANFFQLAIQANPDYAEAYYNLGTLYLRQERTAEARSSLSRAVQLRSHYPSAFNNLGLVALQEGHSKEAVGHFEKAIQQNPHYATALQNLGNMYRQEGRLPEAQATLERALQVDPEDPEINYSLGMVYVQKNDVAHAREYLQKAVKLRPDYPEALNNLGVLYLLTGQKEEASIVLRECIRVAPNFDQPYLNLSKVYAAEGRRQQAQQVLRQLLERNPQHPLARKALADLELRR